MIKFSTRGKNGNLVIAAGISEENVRRLKRGEPIYFSLEDFGVEGTDIIIMYGPTETAIMDELRKQGLLE